MVAVYLQS